MHLLREIHERGRRRLNLELDRPALWCDLHVLRSDIFETISQLCLQYWNVGSWPSW
jgi:hypothetical protein